MVNRDTEVLEDAISTVYDRPDQHGEPENSFGAISDLWQAYLDAAGEPITEKDAAIMLGLLKVARSANGIYDEDNFVDLAGYAEMAARVADGNESGSTAQSDQTATADSDSNDTWSEEATDDAHSESSLFEETTVPPAPDPDSDQLTAIEQSLIQISVLDDVTLFYDFVTRTGENRDVVWQALSALDERYDAFKLHSNNSPPDAEFTFDPTEPTPEPVKELLREYGMSPTIVTDLSNRE